MSQKLQNPEESKDFFKQVIEQTSSIGNEINQTLKSIKSTNSRMHMLSTTAKIEANRTGDVGRNFLVVSNSIDELSQQTDKEISEMEKGAMRQIDKVSDIIEEKSLSIRGNRLTNLASTNIRLIDRSLFERTADVRWWATDEILVNFLMNSNNEEVSIEDAENRLSVILKSYTVYYDLILCDFDGVCQATGAKKFGLEKRDFHDKIWFKKALETKDGTEYGFQSVHHSARINDDYTIVFSCKVHEDGDPKKRVIGVLAAVFKWREFAQRIVNETSVSDDEKQKTRVLICDDLGNVLADTKGNILDEVINFRGKDELFLKEKGFVVIQKNDLYQIVAHALSPGFEGYRSAQWHSIIIQDIEMKSKKLESKISDNTDESLDSVTKLVATLSEQTEKATREISKINDETHVLSLNAAIEAARVGDQGKGFGVISGFMGELSRKTSEITKYMSQKTKEKIIMLNSFIDSHSKRIRGERLTDLSLTNLDFIDRALYERTADVRWWATDNSVIKSLVLKSEESKNYLQTRLAIILRYYTVYDDLVVYDLDGNVIGTGSSQSIMNANQLTENWFQNTLKTDNGESFSFDVLKGDKNSTDTKLIFSCKIHRNGDIHKEVIGILGIIFKWEKFIKTIFDETPLNKDEIVTSSLLITDKNGDFLSINDGHFGKFSKQDILPFFDKPKNHEEIMVKNKKFLLGHARSVGYEGFSTNWHSLIIQSIQSD